jgi:anti-anti-sigma factor
LWVRGDHDIATTVSLVVGVARAAQRCESPVLVDLSAVTFMDASTVGAIIASRNRLWSRGQSLEVSAPSALALRVLELCGLSHLIQQEAVQQTDAAAALATWADVRPIAPGELDAEEVPVAERRSKRQSERGLVAADGPVAEAVGTVKVDRAGP